MGRPLLRRRAAWVVVAAWAAIAGFTYVATRPDDPGVTARTNARVSAVVVTSGDAGVDWWAAGPVQTHVEYLAAVDAYLAALAAREAEEARLAVLWARWWTVGRCEQPTRDGGVEWGLVSSTYSGGLGISNAAWREWGGTEFAPNAGLASPWQQIEVAERIRGAVGRGAWGCPVP